MMNQFKKLGQTGNAAQCPFLCALASKQRRIKVKKVSSCIDIYGGMKLLC
jgi:hypothetical protein